MTIPSNPSKRLTAGLLAVPTLLQHCKAAGARQRGATAAVDVAAAVDSVVDSASEDVRDADSVDAAVVVASIGSSIDEGTAEVEA